MPSQLSRLLVGALAVVFLLSAGATPAAPPAAPALPLRVSPDDGADHFGPDVATAATGGGVVVWQAKGVATAGSDIFARRISPAGAPLGQPFRVNATAEGQQRRPAVAMRPDGGFVVAWDTGTSTVWARRFGPDDAPLDAADLAVAAATGSHFDPDVAALPDGGFVVAWQYLAATTTDVRLRRFGPDGAALGGELAPYGQGAAAATRRSPALASRPDGALALVWEEASPAGDSFTIRLSRYDAAGAAAALAVTVAASDTDELRDPAVALAASGTASVVWAALPGGSPAASRIELRQHDAEGAPSGPAVVLSAATTAARAVPSVATGDWGTLVTWADATTAQGGVAVGLAARSLDPAGDPDGEEYYPRLPQLSAAAVSLVAAAATADGAWVLWGQDPISEGAEIGSIYARRLGGMAYKVGLPMLNVP